MYVRRSGDSSITEDIREGKRVAAVRKRVAAVREKGPCSEGKGSLQEGKRVAAMREKGPCRVSDERRHSMI